MLVLVLEYTVLTSHTFHAVLGFLFHVRHAGFVLHCISNFDYKQLAVIEVIKKATECIVAGG